MSERFGGETAPEAARPERPTVTRAEVEERLARGERLENLRLADLELAGLDLSGQSFRGSDARGLRLWAERQDEAGNNVEARTNLRDSDWSDAHLAGPGAETFFGRVDAQGASFGFSEGLAERRARLEAEGKKPSDEDCGGYHNFNGSQGDFQRTRWSNIDFGGGSGYEAIFAGADLRGARFEGCDLAGIDLSETELDGARIKDPLSLSGLKIGEMQVAAFAAGLEFSDAGERARFAQEATEKGARAALERLGVMVASV